MTKLHLLFDKKQFEVAFRAAIGESSSELQTCRSDAIAHSQSEAASGAVGLSGHGDQEMVRDGQLKRKEEGTSGYGPKERVESRDGPKSCRRRPVI